MHIYGQYSTVQYTIKARKNSASYDIIIMYHNIYIIISSVHAPPPPTAAFDFDFARTHRCRTALDSLGSSPDRSDALLALSFRPLFGLETVGARTTWRVFAV